MLPQSQIFVITVLSDNFITGERNDGPNHESKTHIVLTWDYPHPVGWDKSKNPQHSSCGTVNVSLLTLNLIVFVIFDYKLKCWTNRRADRLRLISPAAV